MLSLALGQNLVIEGRRAQVVGFLRKDRIDYCTFREIEADGQLSSEKLTLSYGYIEAAVEEGAISISS